MKTWKPFCSFVVNFNILSTRFKVNCSNSFFIETRAAIIAQFSQKRATTLMQNPLQKSSGAAASTAAYSDVVDIAIAVDTGVWKQVSKTWIYIAHIIYETSNTVLVLTAAAAAAAAAADISWLQGFRVSADGVAHSKQKLHATVTAAVESGTWLDTFVVHHIWFLLGSTNVQAVCSELISEYQAAAWTFMRCPVSRFERPLLSATAARLWPWRSQDDQTVHDRTDQCYGPETVVDSLASGRQFLTACGNCEMSSVLYSVTVCLLANWVAITWVVP